ncbi:uncharacterized protein [Dasypus novemcinctus]|uniref:uncharacterized protein n=1 Tax=Dasypus novemcinctus TaxID=9361 RepID=UPI00265E1B85|nr:uncharacterized protein LOC131275991 [Dasypus novemcinctus]
MGDSVCPGQDVLYTWKRLWRTQQFSLGLFPELIVLMAKLCSRGIAQAKLPSLKGRRRSKETRANGGKNVIPSLESKPVRNSEEDSVWDKSRTGLNPSVSVPLASTNNWKVILLTSRRIISSVYVTLYRALQALEERKRMRLKGLGFCLPYGRSQVQFPQPPDESKLARPGEQLAQQDKETKGDKQTQKAHRMDTESRRSTKSGQN